MLEDMQNKSFQYPSDFKPPKSINDIQQIFKSHDFYNGRMIGGSKWQYSKKHPEDLIIFNANILMPGYGKVWYGDLNLSQDYKILKRISKCLNETLYILWESDARFGNENNPTEELIKKAAWNTDEDKPTKQWYCRKQGLAE